MTAPAETHGLSAEDRAAFAGMRAGLDAMAAREALGEAEAARGRERLAARGETLEDAERRFEEERAAVIAAVNRRWAAWDEAYKLGRVGKAHGAKLVQGQAEPGKDETERGEKSEAAVAAEAEIARSAATAQATRKQRRTPRAAEVPAEQEVMFR